MSPAFEKTIETPAESSGVFPGGDSAIHAVPADSRRWSRKRKRVRVVSRRYMPGSLSGEPAPPIPAVYGCHVCPRRDLAHSETHIFVRSARCFRDFGNDPARRNALRAPRTWTPSGDGTARPIFHSILRLRMVRSHTRTSTLTRLFMDARKRNEIEAKLRHLMETSGLKQQTPETEDPAPPRVCQVIRRRKGQREKRIFIPE